MEDALRDLNLCLVASRGYRAGMRGMSTRVVVIGLGCAVALLSPTVASAAPTAAVGGIQNPARGTMELHVSAVSDTGLVSASATLDGAELDTAHFEEGACRNPVVRCPGVVSLSVPTVGSDGERTLEITVLDEAGAEYVRTEEITVDNTPPANNPVVIVSVGSGAINPQPSPPGDGGPQPPGGSPQCRSPRLSMYLAQDPLRYRRGVPSLVSGRRYRFEGRLTCIVGNRRVDARRGTEVQVRNLVRGFTVVKPSIEVGRNGRLSVKLAFRSSRVVVFRVVGTGGNVARVRIQVRVVETLKQRRERR